MILFHYLVLLVILNLGVGGFLLFSFDKAYQVAFVLLTSFAYVLWGIIHHWLSEDLHPKVVLEYISISALVDLIILSLILRA